MTRRPSGWLAAVLCCTAGWASAVLAQGGAAGLDPFRPASGATPNVVVILADDLGWGDTDAKVVPGSNPASRDAPAGAAVGAWATAYAATSRHAPGFTDAAVTPSADNNMRAVQRQELCDGRSWRWTAHPTEVFRVGPEPGETAEDGPPGDGMPANGIVIT